MSVERSSATVNDTITLRTNFKYSSTGDYFNPSAISKVEILDSDGTTVLETLTGASIVNDATGQYHIIASAISSAKTIYDKWYFTPASGSTEVTKTNTCVVWAVATETTTTAKLNIINKALTLIGAEPINTLSDGTTNSDIVDRVYTTALKSILSECQWGFATKRALLTTVATTTIAWFYSGDNADSIVYSKPSDIIRIFGTNDDDALWRDEGDYIIADTSGLGLKYVYYTTDAEKYPASFVEALVDLVAYQACFMIVNSASKAREMFEKYEKVSLPKAKSENAQTGVQQYLKDDAWTLAKYNNINPNA